MSRLFEAHRALLERAVEAAGTRDYWSAYPEMPSGKIYGETAKADAEAAFQGMLGKPYDTGQVSPAHVGGEHSPYGFDLGVTYAADTPDALVSKAKAAGGAWGAASVEARVGVALEALARINRQSFLMANAVQHTSGQAFVMAFQAGGPHAQDRALEAIAYAFAEMRRVPGAVTWAKPQGKGDPLTLDKTFRIVPRGVALVIGCATFPTWNGYPGLFASLVTGNTVIVKPHPGAILPLAMTVKVLRDVLAEEGHDPNIVQLAPDTLEAPVTKALVTHADVAIVDFTGSPTFGAWVRANATDKLVYTEEAGLNAIVVDSTSDFKGLCGNVAFSLALYSGQMCTAPQNVFVPAGGIATEQGHKSFDEVAGAIVAAMNGLLGDPARAAGVLGCVQSQATIDRVAAARGLGRVMREATTVDVPGFPNARALSPLVLAVEAADTSAYEAERFGPISFVIRAADTGDAIDRAASGAKRHGAITASLYSTDDDVVARAADAFAAAGVALSVNLTGGVFVNQSAAFSDYHVTGANPAGNACLTDSAFVANRFRVATVRRQKAA